MIAAVLVFLSHTVAADIDGRTECHEGPASKTYWSWREVDSRRCWFQGKRTMPKSMLYWGSKNERRSGLVHPDPVSVVPDVPVILPMSDEALPPWRDPSFWDDPTPFETRRYW